MRRDRGDQALRQARVVVRRRQRPRAIRLLCRRIEIINQEEVDVGRGRYFASAEFAHRNNDGRTSLNAAVVFLHLAGDLLGEAPAISRSAIVA